MNSKQCKAASLNARLNYLIDLRQLSPVAIVLEMSGKVSQGFVENIMKKRLGK